MDTNVNMSAEERDVFLKKGDEIFKMHDERLQQLFVDYLDGVMEYIHTHESELTTLLEQLSEADGSPDALLVGKDTNTTILAFACQHFEHTKNKMDLTVLAYNILGKSGQGWTRAYNTWTTQKALNDAAKRQYS